MSRARPSSFSGKTARKSRRVQRRVQLAVHRRAARFDVGDVEEMVVRAAGKPDPQGLAHGRMRAVAAGDVGRLARLRWRRLPACSRATHSTGASPRSRRAPSRARPGRRPRRSRSINRRSCSSCGKISAYGNGLMPSPMSPKTARATCLPAAQRLIGGHPPAARDDRIGETDLAVQLERARLHGERARRRPGLAVLSTIRTRTPSRVSHSASTRPVGPAPTIRTPASCITARFSVPGARGCRLG